MENIDFDFVYNNRLKIDATYEKNNYLPKTLETIYTILNLSNKNIDGVKNTLLDFYLMSYSNYILSMSI